MRTTRFRDRWRIMARVVSVLEQPPFPLHAGSSQKFFGWDQLRMSVNEGWIKQVTLWKINA
jgi:hypothetical protein